MSARQLMADYVENALFPIDLGDDSHPCYRVEVTDDGHADIIWREDLRFHRERADELANALPGYRPWSRYTDETGALAPANVAKLVEQLKRLTGVDDIETTEDGDPEDEDGYLAFTIRTDYRDGETVQQWADRAGWPIIAALINSTDPGTFSYPYLFSSMLYADD